jgi:uncharacterized RDD family membrane protein YckC
VATTAEAPPSLIAAPPRYAGVATRGVALAVDAALANLLVLAGAGFVSLIGSLVGELRPQWLVTLLAAAAWALCLAGYFVTFWAVTGQTPGMRLMRIRVLDATTATPPHFLRCVIRLVGLVLAIIPLFAGFIPVLFDDRRRALPDLMARTVVVYDDEPAGDQAIPAGGRERVASSTVSDVAMKPAMSNPIGSRVR